MRDEDFRGGVHAAAASLLAVMAVYNLSRLVVGGSRRHALNLAIYAPLWGFELYQTWRHWQADAVPIEMSHREKVLPHD